MMRYKLYINGGSESADKQGLVLGVGAVSVLRQPAELKDYITNDNALMDGIRVLPGLAPKVASRDIQLTFGIQARSYSEFMTRYEAFVATLEKGAVDLRVDVSENGGAFTKGTTYHLLYVSAAQYSEYNGRLAKVVVKFREPNPKNRD